MCAFGPLPEHTDVFFRHSPSFSLLSPSRRYPSPVKVAHAAPLLCLRKPTVPSSFVPSLFSLMNGIPSGMSVFLSIRLKEYRSVFLIYQPSEGWALLFPVMCSLHHFLVPTSSVWRASLSPAIRRIQLRTVFRAGPLRFFS